MDDANMDGLLDEDEAMTVPLTKPDDLLATIGEYTLKDTS